MPSFQRLDAGFYRHDRIVNLPTAEAKWLWVVAINISVEDGSDGLLTRARLTRATREAGAAPADVAAILAEGSWHDKDTVKRCPRCKDAVKLLPPKKLGDGEYLIHDFLHKQLPGAGASDEMVQWRGRRERRLKAMPELRLAVRLRDDDRCRYCDRPVKFGTPDRRSPNVGEIDHRDPYSTEGDGYGNTFDNLRVACRPCNGRKRDHTPEQLGLTEYPPANPDAPRFDPGRDPGRSRVGSGSDSGGSPDSLAGAHEGGPVRVGSGSNLGSNLGPTRVPTSNGSSSNGHGPGGGS